MVVWLARVAAVASLAFMAGGCYMYVPVGATAPQPGARLRAELADSGSAQVVPRLGPGVTAVEGSLVASQPPRLTLAVNAFHTAQMGRVNFSGEPLDLSRAGVSTLEERRLSRPRTVLFIGAIALGGLLLDRRIFGGGSTSSTDGQGPQQPY